MPQPYDYTYKGPTPAEGYMQGARFAQEQQAGSLAIRGAQLQTGDLEDKRSAMSVLADVMPHMQLTGDARNDAILQSAQASGDPKRIQASHNFVQMSPEEQMGKIQGITEHAQKRGWLKGEGAAPSMKAVYDTEAGQDVFASNKQIGEGSGRFVPRPQQEAVKVYPPGYTETLPDFPEYTPRTYNIEGQDRDLGTPGPVTNQLQYAAREKEAETYHGPAMTKIRAKHDSSMNTNARAYDRLIGKQIEYTQANSAGTGQFASFAGTRVFVDEDLETLKALFLDQSWKKTMEIAAEAGAKSVDSDAEKKALRATVGSVTNDDKTNLQLLLGGQAVNRRMMRRKQERTAYFANNTTMDGYKSTVFSDKMVYNPTAPYGTPGTFITPAQDAEYKKRGWMQIDEYIDFIVDGEKDIGLDMNNPANW